VLDIYWDKVRKNLSSIENNHVYLKGLGTLYLKPWMVEKKIKVNEHIIDRYIQNPTTGGLTILNGLMKDNLKLNDAKERLTEE